MSAHHPTYDNASPDTGPVTVEAGLPRFLDTLRRVHHHDFSDYSRPSLVRRATRAVERAGCTDLVELEELMALRRDVVATVLRDLTVQVSDLFRDPAYFTAFRERVVPCLAREDEPRLWVAGCATGEEVWSLAIVLDEEGLLGRCRIYATDVEPRALAVARSGVYAAERIPSATERHRSSGGRTSLSEHYTAAYGRALFDRRLVERVVWSDHSLTTDSVFAEVDFVSCRNVLIYFGQSLRQRAVTMFREALTDGGHLGVGSRESLRFSGVASSFEELPGSARIYRKRSVS